MRPLWQKGAARESPKRAAGNFEHGTAQAVAYDCAYDRAYDRAYDHARDPARPNDVGHRFSGAAGL